VFLKFNTKYSVEYVFIYFYLSYFSLGILPVGDIGGTDSTRSILPAPYVTSALFDRKKGSHFDIGTSNLYQVLRREAFLASSADDFSVFDNFRNFENRQWRIWRVRRRTQRPPIITRKVATIAVRLVVVFEPDCALFASGCLILLRHRHRLRS
jgi:hypothetical protein